MKRPERPAASSAESARSRPARTPATGTPATKPVTSPAAQKPTPRRPLEKPAKPTPLRAPRPPREEAPRVDSRRAERLRRRYEKAEVKRFTRRARRRRIGWVAAFGVLGTIAALIAAAIFSPILALREVRVVGAARLDPAVIAEAVSGQLGTPLALLDEARLRDELGEFAAIRSFATELEPPGTLVIHLVERTPLGLVATAEGFDVVDAAGVVLESAEARPPGLPLLQLDDDGTGGRAFTAIAEVLVALPPDVLAQVDSITARTRDDVTLSLAGSAQRVVWGSASDSPRKATVLSALLAMFGGSGAGVYDVSAPGSAVFRAE